MKAASDPSRMMRARACHEATPVTKRRGVPKMASPARKRSSRAVAPRCSVRHSSRASAPSPATMATEMNGWPMTKVTSIDGTSPVEVGTGRNPLESAHATSAVPNSVSKTVSGTKVAGERRVAAVVDPPTHERELHDVAAAGGDDGVEARPGEVGRHRVRAAAGGSPGRPP